MRAMSVAGDGESVVGMCADVLFWLVDARDAYFLVLKYPELCGVVCLGLALGGSGEHVTRR